MKALYLLLDLFSISIPLIRSFEPKVRFNQQWKYLFPAILITGSFFIVWDIIFTNHGIWGFNPRYLLGVFLGGLPVEEWLFFICIPYACLFTYVALNFFIEKDWLGPYARNITLVLVLILSVVGLSHFDKAYTFTTFALTVGFLMLHLWVFKSKYLGRFYLAYAVILLPFFLVNGILTGSFIEEQVVWYNDQENLGIRLFTIPIEDSIYGMLLILMNVTIFEWFKKRDSEKS